MKHLKYLLFPLLATFLLLSCSDDDDKVSSSENLIISFTVNGVKAAIDQDARLITATLPYDTDRTQLTPVLEISDKARVSPTSGSVVDFSKDVRYFVVSEDRTEREYEVYISLERSPIAKIYQFWVNDIPAIIDEKKKTIDVKLPPHLEKAILIGRADFESMLSPSLSWVRFYTEPMDFKVTAANGVNTAIYTLTIDYEKFVTKITELTNIDFVAGQTRKTFYAKGYFGSNRRATEIVLWDVDKDVRHEIKTYFFKEPDGSDYCKSIEIMIPDAIPAGVYELRVACYNSESVRATQKITIP